MCVPVCELRKSSSRLYPSLLILFHGMNNGFGELGNVGNFSEIVRVRSSGTMEISELCNLSVFEKYNQRLNSVQ